MRSLHLGTSTIELHDSLMTVTRLHDGREIKAWPQEDEAYRARAVELGYGADTFAMSRDHEILHSLIAVWLGLPESPTLRGAATRQWWPNWRQEEGAVLAMQALCRALGVDVVVLAERLSR